MAESPFTLQCVFKHDELMIKKLIAMISAIITICSFYSRSFPSEILTTRNWPVKQRDWRTLALDLLHPLYSELFLLPLLL